jgi:hypothetical protein
MASQIPSCLALAAAASHTTMHARASDDVVASFAGAPDLK